MSYPTQAAAFASAFGIDTQDPVCSECGDRHSTDLDKAVATALIETLEDEHKLPSASELSSWGDFFQYHVTQEAIDRFEAERRDGIRCRDCGTQENLITDLRCEGCELDHQEASWESEMESRWEESTGR